MNTSESTVTIYHNPRCSKSRATLALLEENGITPQVIEYLKTPPTKVELAVVLKKLGMAAKDLVRTGEDVFKDKFRGKTLDDAGWLSALAENPVLIERPIVIRGRHAVIGRPPEKVLELI
jgi:arsenate reductase (glutaredoxin)